jgi:hypothetical protein
MAVGHLKRVVKNRPQVLGSACRSCSTVGLALGDLEPLRSQGEAGS